MTIGVVVASRHDGGEKDRENEGGGTMLRARLDGERPEEVRWRAARSSDGLQWRPSRAKMIPTKKWPDRVGKVEKEVGRLSCRESERDVVWH